MSNAPKEDRYEEWCFKCDSVYTESTSCKCYIPPTKEKIENALRTIEALFGRGRPGRTRADAKKQRALQR